MIDSKEYEVCKKRKHQLGGKDGEWNICKFCGVRYRYVTKLVEQK